jgi:hypothetical protein
MPFDANSYGPEIATILRLDGSGDRLIPLVCDRAASVTGARQALQGRSAADLFPHSAHPIAALAGLWVYYSEFEAAHAIAQDDNSVEGSYWHAILHRQEPDDFNSGYWFRRVGKRHPVFAPLAKAAAEIADRHPGCGLNVNATDWDPHAFIDYCSSARASPGSLRERVALEVQSAEWRLLFHHCASSPQHTKDPND